MKKSSVKDFRFDEKTANLLKNKAALAGVSESEYVRRLINSDLEVVEKELLKMMTRQIAAMGNNINQIAHRANMNMYSQSDINTIEEFKIALLEYKFELSKLRQKYQ